MDATPGRLARMLLPLLLIIAATPTVTAGTIHVDHAGGGDYLTIQKGIGAATYGDTVLVAPGTYYEHLTMGPAADGVTLLGASGAENTVVSNESTYPYSVLFCHDLGHDTRVAGMTFDGGYADLHGGGVRCDSAHVLFEDIVVTNCSALESHGGGIGAVDSDLTILDSVIQNNRAGNGGGISVVGGSMTATGNELFGNSADGVALERWGGGLYIACDGALVHDNHIMGNSALDGGGIAVSSSAGTTITESTIKSNSATDRAGAIYLHESDCRAEQNLIIDNYAITTGGGAVDIDLASRHSGLDRPIFTGNTFHNNSAFGCDAAIRLHDGGLPPEFSGNYFANTTTYEILVVTTPTRLTIDFTGNWWGSEDPLEIADKIYDCEDNGGLAWCVDYSDWCDEPSCGGQATSVDEPGATTPVSWGQLKSIYR